MAKIEAVQPPLFSDPAGDARIGPLMGLPQLLEELQVSSQQAFRDAGLTVRLFDNPENLISHNALMRLLSSCTALSNRHDIGLLIGSRFNLTKFGALGDLMRNAATVGEALKALILHLHFYDRAAVPMMFKLGPENVFLGYSIQQPVSGGTAQLQDAAIAVAYKMLSELCGADWKPHHVEFSHRRPATTVSYRRVFGADISFDAPVSGISFSTSWLPHRITGADPGKNKQLNEILRNAGAGGPISIAEEVQCVIHQLLPGGNASAASVARLFGISERTLRLRLQAEGTNLQVVLAATRFELARHLLQNTAQSMSKIAAALCYADSAIFSRAFSSWAGVGPRQWRKENG